MSRWIIALALLLMLAAAFIACGGGGGTTAKTQAATVNVSVSDPATCAASTGSTGPYLSVFVTITDVQIHTSATAGDNDPNWVDLTPNLKNAPQQVNLLGIANNQCFLASLGSNTSLQPGSYQQIRILLADNSFKVPNDTQTCKGVAANCVVLAADASNPLPLLLSSETRTGIKVPPGQIAGGQFTIAGGETKDLNIDFDACASIITERNGQFRMKPVLRAGEVKLTSSSINGKLVDNNNQPIVGGKSIVALEENINGTYRVFMEVTPDASGNFNFCPVLGDGPFLVVAVAVNGSNQAYAATVTTGVTPGTALGNVQMFPAAAGSAGLASLPGVVTTANAPTVGIQADIRLSALQSATVGTTTPTTFTFTVPASMQAAVPIIPTDKPSGCTTDPCPPYTASYTMTLPPANPTIGSFSVSGTNYAPDPATAGSYNIEAQAFVHNSLTTTMCNPSNIKNSIIVPPATSIPSFAFLGCQ